MIKFRILNWSVLAGLLIISVACREEVYGPEKSPERAIISFSLYEQQGGELISVLAETPAIYRSVDSCSVSAMVLSTAKMSQLIPKIEVSDQATVDPPSGSTVDFSSGQAEFTVTAEDGQKRTWQVVLDKYELPQRALDLFEGKWKMYQWFYWATSSDNGVINAGADSDNILQLNANGTFEFQAGDDGQYLTSAPEARFVPLPKKGYWYFYEYADHDEIILNPGSDSYMRFELVFYRDYGWWKGIELIYYPVTGLKMGYKLTDIN